MHIFPASSSLVSRTVYIWTTKINSSKHRLSKSVDYFYRKERSSLGVICPLFIRGYSIVDTTNQQAYKGLVRNYYRRFSTMSDTEDKKAELKKRLTPIQYQVTQEKGTERAFTGKYNTCSEAGTYSCVVCDQPLFSSQTKFDSGCGWPAFNNVLDQGKVKLTKDTSHVGANLLLLIANPGMIRTEVTCSQCGAHLGHVFGDGPPPTKKRFCINSASMQFHPAEEGSQEST